MTKQTSRETILQSPDEKAEGDFKKTYTSRRTDINIALRYSVYLSASFIVIFMVARLTGFARFTEIRFINYILYYPIGFAAIKRAYHLNHNYIEYFKGLMISFVTVVAAQLWYAILFIIYLTIDRSFLDYLVAQMPQPFYYPKSSIFFVMMVEGLGAASILSLTLMQYFKWKRGRWAFRR